jgi:hypothetical protein
MASTSAATSTSAAAPSTSAAAPLILMQWARWASVLVQSVALRVGIF